MPVAMAPSGDVRGRDESALLRGVGTTRDGARDIAVRRGIGDRGVDYRGRQQRAFDAQRCGRSGSGNDGGRLDHELSQRERRAAGCGARLSTAISTRCPPQAGQMSSDRPKSRA